MTTIHVGPPLHFDPWEISSSFSAKFIHCLIVRTMYFFHFAQQQQNWNCMNTYVALSKHHHHILSQESRNRKGHTINARRNGQLFKNAVLCVRVRVAGMSGTTEMMIFSRPDRFRPTLLSPASIPSLPSTSTHSSPLSLPLPRRLCCIRIAVFEYLPIVAVVTPTTIERWARLPFLEPSPEGWHCCSSLSLSSPLSPPSFHAQA